MEKTKVDEIIELIDLRLAAEDITLEALQKYVKDFEAADSLTQDEIDQLMFEGFHHES